MPDIAAKKKPKPVAEPETPIIWNPTICPDGCYQANFDQFGPRSPHVSECQNNGWRLADGWPLPLVLSMSTMHRHCGARNDDARCQLATGHAGMHQARETLWFTVDSSE